MRIPLKLIAIVAGLGLSFAGCTESNPGANFAANSDLIRRGNIEDPESLDPVLAEDVHSFNILIDLYEGLVAEDAHGELVPGVAESWSVSDDGLLYRFKLRSNAHWSNGDAVTARDFVRGLHRAAAPATHSSYAMLLESIENFAEVKSGELPLEALGIVEVDSRTLLIRLGKPSAYFLSLMAMPVAFPLYGDGWSAAQFEEPAKFVGNGAYVLTQRRVGHPVVLRRNQHYWDAGSVKTDSVEYVAIVDEVAEFNMYRAGELDITGTIPPSHVDQAKERLGDEVRIAPSLALYYLAFDLSETPLDDSALRQALSMAIDREQLVVLLGRGEEPAFAVVPPGVASHDSPAYQWRNLSNEEQRTRARQLYASAGYGAENPLKLNFVYDSGGVHEKIALVIAAMWQDTLGVIVKLDKREWKYFLQTRASRNEWQVMRFSWFGDYNDASTFLDIFHSENAQNLPEYKNSNYDQLLDSASLSTDRTLRTALLEQAEGLLINDYPIAPLYFYVSKHMVKPNVLGFKNNILDRHPTKFLVKRPVNKP